MALYAIYTLSDPKTGDIFYVGCTTRIMQRAYQHSLVHCKGVLCPNKKDRHIIEMGCDPLVTIIQTLKIDAPGINKVPLDAANAETKWIKHYSELGFKLMNTSFQKYGISRKAFAVVHKKPRIKKVA